TVNLLTKSSQVRILLSPQKNANIFVGIFFYKKSSCLKSKIFVFPNLFRNLKTIDNQSLVEAEINSA
ncbi:MAG: hypothetical protein MUF43_06560, partial [Flavobacterium sp.]|nr:hypothetical protein [Flavobacterium sp.]